MADKKNDTKVAPVAGNIAPGGIDLAALAPEGFEVADAYRTGLLTPLYLPRFALEHKFPVSAGWLDRIHIMPTQTRSTGSSKRKDEADEEWTPFNLIVRDLRVPTKGIRRNEMGLLTEKSIVDVAVGDKILLPITGQVTVNQDLQDALRDVDHVYWVTFSVPGTKQVNNLNAMYDWDIRFLVDGKKNKIKKRREGEFTLDKWYVDAMMRGDFIASISEGTLVGSLGARGLTADGQPYDPTTGEIPPGAPVAGAMTS